MLRKSYVAALFFCSLVVPFSFSLADDEKTETLHNNTYQESSSASCQSIRICFMYFPQTQHENTVITAISCSFDVVAGGQILGAQLRSSLYSSAIYTLPTFFFGTANNTIYQGINARLQLFVKQGESPVFLLAPTDGAADIICTISGYHS